MSSPVVFMILADKLSSLEGLINVLDERFQIIVHVDAKVEIGTLANRLPSNVTLLEKRRPVYWGGFNMCEAAILMIDEAYRIAPNFKRLVFITADTLPTVPLERLETALLDPRDEYIQLIDIPNDPSLRGIPMEASRSRHGSVQAWRFQNFVCWDNELQSPRSRSETMEKFGIPENRVDTIRHAVYQITGSLISRLPPRLPLYSKLFYGVSWWALSREAIDLILDEIHASLHLEYFRFLQVPDEHFFQTLLGNKSMALSSLKKVIKGPLVYVDYDSALRAEFKGMDFLSAEGFRKAYESHKMLFARKYIPHKSPDIANAIFSGRYFSDILSA